ncbi:helix-turn-helix domain-containing protein [Leptospira perdikensis]|uniref:AraC family transcriptional regulator n=1 Tax=Leptospira perdikensis TaxID=2484948 RepID=A0A4V3JP88_9LEPT|nr:helix-turn-helix domain-containing protein [Leptospira perdikensis]TGL40326.1 AraC family transcriptional regulator [Leptospira perdikensis]
MNLIPFVGAVVAFLLAVSYWMETIQKGTKKKQTNLPSDLNATSFRKNFDICFLNQYTTTFLFFSLTILQLHIYVELTKEMNSYPLFYGIHIPCLLLLGPLSYLFFEEMSGGEFSQIHFLHFLPSILSIFYIFFFRPAGFVLPSLDSQTHSDNSYTTSITILLGVGVVSIFCYMFAIFVRVIRWKLNSKISIESSFQPFLFLLLYSLLVMVLFVFAQLFFMQIFLIACVSLTCLLILVLLSKMNHKDLILNFKTETRLARYKESRVKGIDIAQVLQRLDDLMNVDKLYLNEDLTLLTLAKELDLDSHQLSEILNSRLGCTFRNYVNQFRLQEAARLLLERYDMTILSIIYASGFNSKSSFHKLFQNRFGLSPQNYRTKTK